MIDKTYHYKAKVNRIIDGDTIVVTIDLGFAVSIKKTLRLARINTPEIRGPEKVAGKRSKNYVKGIIPVGTTIVLHSLKLDSFGRAIAEVWIESPGWEDPGLEWVNMSDHLVEYNYAEYKEY